MQHTCAQGKYDGEPCSGQAEAVLYWWFVALSRDPVTGPALVFQVELKHASVLKLNSDIELLSVDG